MLIKLYKTTKAKLPDETIIINITKPKSADPHKNFILELKVTFTTLSLSRSFSQISFSFLVELKFNSCALYLTFLLNTFS